MMPDDELMVPIVSIQDARREDAVSGHMAWGELISPQLVAVRGSTWWTEDPLARFEVLLAAPEDALPERAGIERIKPQRIELIPPGADGAERGALVWLAQSSTFLAPYPESLGPLDPAGRESDGPPKLPPERDTAAVLEPVAARELELRRGLVQLLPPGEENFRMWWCFIFGGC